jgi:protein-disulfide isomerase
MLKKLNIAAAVLLSVTLAGVVAWDISHFAQVDTVKPASLSITTQQACQEVAAMKAMTAGVLAFQAELLHDHRAPSYGPADAKVVVTHFFDYQCIYCSRLAPVLTKVMEANPQVRFMFREWPIFSDRWPLSRLAAEAGLTIWQQKGAEAYLAYHNGLYATGHNEGALTVNDIRHSAGAVKFDSAKMKSKDVPDELNINNQLALDIGFTGTPGLVVMPATGATMETVTVITGMTDREMLQIAINKAAGLTVAGMK